MNKRNKIKYPVLLNTVDGRRCWRAIIKALKNRKLNAVETNIVIGICQAWSTFHHASIQLNSNNDLSTAHELSDMANFSYKNFIDGCKQLGLVGINSY